MKRECPRGYECWFAHGYHELRKWGTYIEDFLEGHRLRNPNVYYFVPKKRYDDYDYEDEEDEDDDDYDDEDDDYRRDDRRDYYNNYDSGHYRGNYLGKNFIPNYRGRGRGRGRGTYANYPSR